MTNKAVFETIGRMPAGMKYLLQCTWWEILW